MESHKMIRCPKCEFEQPDDQYCAKCGVDMSRVEVKKAPLTRHPLFIGTVALLAVGATVQTIRAIRPFTDADPMSLNGERRQTRARLLKSDASPELRARIEQKIAEKAAEDSAENEEQSPSESAPPAPIAAAPAAAAPLRETEPATGSASPKTAEPRGTAVTFAWAEASTEWLTGLGANEPGLHPIPELEAHLREARGAYRVLNVSKNKLSDQSTPVVVKKSTGEAALMFTPHADQIAGSMASGTLQVQLRRGIASRQEPLSGAIDLVPGGGYIVRVNLPASQPGFETIIVVLPR
ncbi:MAG: hypothetical protein JNJ49_05985 [Bdellovibrionaceae bacterium]|nr:hypothetical protein [Pseudobdellovibrionaceae bacterium]